MLAGLRSDNLLPASWGESVWWADTLAQAAGVVLPSGYARLDAALPGGGWPLGALCELLQPPAQQHEWRLLLPGLCACAHRHACSVVLVGAPHTPFGPGLAASGFDVGQLLWLKVDAAAERLWSAEQALRCDHVQAVLAWLPVVRATQLRRLHLAAQAHGKLLFVMRPASARDEASPAVLRLLVQQGSGADLAVRVLKRRGPLLSEELALEDRRAAFSVFLAAARAHHTPAGAARGAQPSLLFSQPAPSHVLDSLAGAA